MQYKKPRDEKSSSKNGKLMENEGKSDRIFSPPQQQKLNAQQYRINFAMMEHSPNRLNAQ